MKEKEVYDAYQKCSGNTDDTVEKLALMFVLILCSALIGNKLITSFVVSGAMSLVCLLFSVMQSTWQTVGLWIVKQRMDPDKEIFEYPVWIGAGAWVFYFLKIIAIVIAVVYFVKDTYYLMFA